MAFVAKFGIDQLVSQPDSPKVMSQMSQTLLKKPFVNCTTPSPYSFTCLDWTGTVTLIDAYVLPSIFFRRWDFQEVNMQLWPIKQA